MNEKNVLNLILHTRKNDHKRFESLAQSHSGNEMDKFFYVLSCFNISDIFDSLSQENILKLSLFFDTQDKAELKNRIDYFINLKGKKYWSKKIIKLPVNYLNTSLTTKSATFKKINSDVRELENNLKKTTDLKEKKDIKKQIKRANEMLERCGKNFLENYKLSVYEKFAIFGGFKILSDNNLKITPFYFVDLMKSLGFKDTEGTELVKIKKAMVGLTKKRFPCYMIFPDKTDSKVYNFIDSDEPIFKFIPLEKLNLNPKTESKNISTSKLYLQLNNLTLITDLTDSQSLFYVIIHSDLIANLRAFKKVREWDLNFLEFLIKTGNFYKHGKPKKIELNKLCGTIKKNDYLNNKGVFKNRVKQYRFKKMIENLCEFAVKEKLLKGYAINRESAIFEFKKSKNVNDKELIK